MRKETKAAADKKEPEKQEDYALGLEEEGFDYGLAVGSAFVESMRNTYYKHTGTALNELVDNAIEARANLIQINIHEQSDGACHTISVLDNGLGMTPSVLRLALQFGGTTRFNARNGAGRFGMGLPNSSLSQTKRVEACSWRTPTRRYWSYLDVDEIASGACSEIPAPRLRRNIPGPVPVRLPKHGTLIT